MNQGRIWCVVNPAVGLPLFIGGVAVTSLVVHASVMSHTTWMSNYWQGAAAKTASVETIAPVASNVSKTDDGYVITLVTDSRDWTSQCLVFDATDIAQGPVSRVHLPQRVPFGFHATWAPGDALYADQARVRNP